MRFIEQYRVPAIVTATVLAVLLVHRPSAAQTQTSGTAIALVAGPFQYDLSGTGTSVFGAARLEIPLARYLLLEPGLTFGRYDAQFGSAVSLLFPEVQIQVGGTRGQVNPYLGAGVGPAFAFSNGASDTELALSGAVGVRVRLTREWGARAELRVRAIDPFAGTTAEWGLGISRRL